MLYKLLVGRFDHLPSSVVNTVFKLKLVSVVVKGGHLGKCMEWNGMSMSSSGRMTTHLLEAGPESMVHPHTVTIAALRWSCKEDGTRKLLFEETEQSSELLLKGPVVLPLQWHNHKTCIGFVPTSW